MIFKAIVVPTPKRIKKYFEDTFDRLNTESVVLDDISKESIEHIKHIDVKKDNFENPGVSIKLF